MSLNRQIFIAFSVILFLKGVHTFTWTKGGDDYMYVCEGDNATFLWEYSQVPADHIVSTEWTFSGTGNDVLIGNKVRDNLLVSAEYSGRAESPSNAGLVIMNVVQADSGVYNVSVSVVNSDNHEFHTETHSATLVVATVSSAARDATLRVSQRPEAVYDATSGEFHMELVCSSEGQVPREDIMWETPSGSTHGSTNSSGGNFRFLVPNPVENGNYTCRVPLSSSAAKCLPANSTALQGASIVLDKTQSRLALVEAEIRQLKTVNSDLQQQNSDLKEANANLTALTQALTETMKAFNPNASSIIENYFNSLTQNDEKMKAHIDSMQLNLTSENTQLKQQNENLTAAVRNLENALETTNRKVEGNDAALTQIVQNHTSTQLLLHEVSQNLTNESAERRLGHTNLVSQLDKLEQRLQAERNHQKDDFANLTDSLQLLESDLRAENTYLQEENNNLTEYIHNARDDLLQEEADLKDFTRHLAENLTAESLRLKQENVQLTDYLLQLEHNMTSEHDRLREKTVHLTESLTQVETSVDQVSQNMTGLISTIENAIASQDSRTLDNLTEQIKAVENTVSQAGDDMANSMESLRQNLTTEVSQMKAEQASMTAYVHSMESTLKQKDDSLEQDLQNMESRLAAEHSRLADNDTALSQRMDSAQAALQAMETRLVDDTTNITQHVNGLDNRLQVHRANLTHMASYIESNMTAQITDLKVEGDNVSRQLSSVEARLKAQDQILAEEDANLKTLLDHLETSVLQDRANQTQQLQTLQADLKSDTDRLTQQTSQLTDHLHDLENNTTLAIGQLKDGTGNVTSLVQSLISSVEELTAKQEHGASDLMQAVHNMERRINDSSGAVQIAFHARLSNYLELPQGEVIVADEVITNVGKGYNSATGYFAAPVDGSYFFMATTACYQPNKHAGLNLVVDGDTVGYASAMYESHYEMNSCHAAAHLQKGQRVWIQSADEQNYFVASMTAFTGFLIAADASP